MALSSADVAALNRFDPIFDATQSMSYCGTQYFKTSFFVPSHSLPGAGQAAGGHPQTEDPEVHCGQPDLCGRPLGQGHGGQRQVGRGHGRDRQDHGTDEQADGPSRSRSDHEGQAPLVFFSIFGGQKQSWTSFSGQDIVLGQ